MSIKEWRIKWMGRQINATPTEFAEITVEMITDLATIIESLERQVDEKANRPLV